MRVLTRENYALDHRAREVTLPATAALKLVERRPLPFRTRLHQWGEHVLLADETGIYDETTRATLDAKVLRLHAAASGDVVALLADGRVCRWRPGGELRVIETVPDARGPSVMGAGDDDVFTFRARPAFLEKLGRHTPRWAYCVARTGMWRRRGWLPPELVVDDMLIAHDYRRGLRALDLATGKPRWRAWAPAGRLVGVVGDRVWCTADHHIVALDLATGGELLRVKTVARVPGGTLDARGRLHMMPATYYVHDLTTDGNADRFGTAMPMVRGGARDLDLRFTTDGRTVGGSARGDVFVVDNRDTRVLRTGKGDESVMGFCAAANRVYALVVDLADSDHVLETYG